MGCSYWNLFLMIQWQSWLRTLSIIMNWCDSVQCCDGVRTRLWWLLWWVAGRGRCESSYDHNQCNMGTLWFILKPITLMFLTDEETENIICHLPSVHLFYSWQMFRTWTPEESWKMLHLSLIVTQTVQFVRFQFKSIFLHEWSLQSMSSKLSLDIV